MKFEVNGKVIPTNKKYKTTINGKTVYLTHVSCNGKTVWKYVASTGGGGGHYVSVGPAFQTTIPGMGGASCVKYSGATCHCAPNADGKSWTCIPMKWVPNDEPYEPDEVDIDIDDIILKDDIEDID